MRACEILALLYKKAVSGCHVYIRAKLCALASLLSRRRLLSQLQQLSTRATKRARGEDDALASSSSSSSTSSSSAALILAPSSFASFDDDDVTLVVGGLTVIIPRSGLLRHPDTMLGRMFQDSNRPMWEGKGPYQFSERDGEVFKSVAAFYATGKLTPPSFSASVYMEYDFWLVAPLPPRGLKPPMPFRSDTLEQMLAMTSKLFHSMANQLSALAFTGGSTTLFVPRQPKRMVVQCVQIACVIPGLAEFSSNEHPAGGIGCTECECR